MWEGYCGERDEGREGTVVKGTHGRDCGETDVERELMRKGMLEGDCEERDAGKGLGKGCM